MEFVYNLIPINYIEELRYKTSNEIEFLETLAFEISYGINKNKLEDCIKASEYLITLRPNLKYLIESSIKKQRPTIPICSFANYFGFEHKEIPEEDIPIVEDNTDYLTTLSIKDAEWDKNIYKVGSLLNKSIRYESIKLCKQILLTINSNQLFDCNRFRDIKSEIIRTGNLEIIRIFQQSGLNYDNLSKLVFMDSHHFDIIDWGMNVLCVKVERTLRLSTHSLYFHFVEGIPFRPCVVDNDDISCIIDSFTMFSLRELYSMILNKESVFRRTDNIAEIEIDEILSVPNEKKLNPTMAIIENCKNMIYSINFEFTINNLGCAILYDRFEIFQFILEKININSSPIGVTNMNILQLAIIKGNVKYIGEIIKKNSTLLYLTDSFENNVFHYAMRQESKEIFKYLENNISPQEFVKMIQYKNNDNESPIDLGKKYEHFDFYL